MRPWLLGKLFAVLFLFTAVSGIARAQSLPSPTYDDQLGMQPYGAYHGGDIDVVGLSNGTLALNMPFLSYPQRGSLKFSFNLYYNNESQHVALEQEGKTYYDIWGYAGVYTPLPLERGDVFVGWAQQVGVVGTAINLTEAPVTYHYGNYSIQLADGSKHPLGNLGTFTLYEKSGTNTYYTYGGPFETLDGTGWRMNGPFNTGGVFSGPATGVIGPDGVMYGPTNGAAVEDPNGNQITKSVTAFTDSLGRVIPIPPTATSKSNTDTSGCPTTPLPVAFAVLWSVPSLGNVDEPYKFCYAQIAINIPPVDGAQASAGNSTHLQSIVLPNGTTWNFAYNDPGDGSMYNGSPISYGTLTQVTLPTGGTLSYTYSTLGTLNCGLEGRWVATRTLNANDGTGSHTWTYNYTFTNYVVGSTTVTDPLGNYAVHTLGGGCAPVDAQVQYYSSAGVLLKTVNTTYGDAAPSGNSNTNINVVPTLVKTTWANGQTDQATMAYDSGFSYSDYVGNKTYGTGNTPDVGLYGKVITKADYDYGSPGSVLRTTTTAYQALNSGAYLTNNMLNLPSSVKITGTQTAYTTYGYDENSLATSGISTQHDSSPPTGTARGNQTLVHRQLNNGSATATTNCAKSVSSGGYLVSYATYYDTGIVSNSVDSCGSSATDTLHMTTYLYSSTYVGAYPTSVTNPKSQTTTHTYDFDTGLLASTNDPNSQITNFSYDSMWRLASASYPDGGSSTITHQESSFPFTATLAKKITSSQNYVTTNLFDGLGRLYQSQLTDPQGTIYTDTTYDADGRKGSVSNPYRSKTESTYGITSYVYDGLGRTCVVVPPDGTAAGPGCPATQPSNDVFTTYAGNTTTVTDQAGISRESQTDGLGRLTNVWENPSGLNYKTTYTYDNLDNLLSVTQGSSHGRGFSFDSLKRLTSSTNPETGNVTYTYDADSNVVTKKDARAFTITYSYDTLNRMTGRTYSNGDPAVGYAYDQSTCVVVSTCYNVGRRTGMTDAGGSESWAYDTMGREWGEQRTTNSITKKTGYTYNFDGSLATLTYPSGRTITYIPDSAGRPSEAQDLTNSVNFVQGTCANGVSSSGACYAPQGAVASLVMGPAGSFAGITLSDTYNNRLQPNEIKASSTAGTAMDLSYSFVDASSHNNGNVMGITNNLDSTRSQVFTYDQLNRLVTAETTSTYASSPSHCWGEAYVYDNNTTSAGEFGNLTNINAASSSYNGCIQESLSVAATTNNQLSATGFSYDASGNLLTDGTNTYGFNAESEIKSAAGVNYTYDGDGNRLQKSNSKIYWYGAGTEILNESDASGNITDEYVYFGGERIARRDSSANIVYYVEDQLGSSRVVTNSAGTVLDQSDFYPFGGERVIASSSGNVYKFEGKERDAETINDNFGARYYSSRFGRWLSPDWSSTPAPVPYANPTNPQTLNLYAMARDNPETFADLDGHELSTPVEYGGNITVAGPGDFGPPPTMTAVNNLSDFSEASYYSSSGQGQNSDAKDHTVTVVQVKGEDGNPAGHVAIGIDGATPVGLVPDSDKAAAKALAKEIGAAINGIVKPSAVPGHVESLSKDRKTEATAVIHVTAQQAAAMREAVGRMSGPQAYDPTYRNCASFVEETLRSGSVKAPGDITPGGLVSDLKKQYPQ